MRRPGSHQIRRAAAKTTSKQGQLKKQGAEPLRKHICDKYAGMILTKMCTWCLAYDNTSDWFGFWKDFLLEYYFATVPPREWLVGNLC